MSIKKTETEVRTLEFEFGRALEYQWRAGHQYTAGDYVRPTSPNGYEYECTTGGQSQSREPKWVTTIASTNQDGSVVWTCRAFGTNGTDTISSVNVTADSGLSVGSDTVANTLVSVPISGGTKGQCYTVSCEVTAASGDVLEKKREVIIYDD